MQDFLLYSAIPGPGRSRPVPACPADSHCVIVYPPAIQIATLDLLNFIKNESWVPCKMQNGGVGPAEVISSLRGILPPSLQSLPPSRGKACGRVRTPAPTAYTETVPSFVGAGPRPARRSRTSCYLLGKARRGCGIASASIFGKPGPGGPDVIMKSHSDFARREFCFPRQVRVPRYGGSRGTANMDTECPS